MSIRKIRKVPTQLPDAVLYLDDIEEISLLLLEAFSGIPLAEGDSRHVTYTVDTVDVCDSIASLEERGGHSTNLQIALSDNSFSRLRVVRLLAPELELYSLSEDEKWALFGKIERIFFSRSSELKKLLPTSTKSA